MLHAFPSSLIHKHILSIQAAVPPQCHELEAGLLKAIGSWGAKGSTLKDELMAKCALRRRGLVGGAYWATTWKEERVLVPASAFLSLLPSYHSDHLSPITSFHELFLSGSQLALHGRSPQTVSQK